MSLIGNYSVLNKAPGRFSAGAVTAGGPANSRGNFNKSNTSFSKAFAFQDPTEPVPIDTESFSFPQGYNFTEALVPSIKANKIDMATTNQIGGLGAIVSNASLLKGMNASVSGFGTITFADLKLSVNMQASITGGGVVTSADVKGVGSMEASLQVGGTSVITPSDINNIAGAVLDELVSSHVSDGSLGKVINDIKGNAGLIPALL